MYMNNMYNVSFKRHYLFGIKFPAFYINSVETNSLTLKFSCTAFNHR